MAENLNMENSTMHNTNSTMQNTNIQDATGGATNPSISLSEQLDRRLNHMEMNLQLVHAQITATIEKLIASFNESIQNTTLSLTNIRSQLTSQNKSTKEVATQTNFRDST
ncbi:unnamed protein product [Lupinus luteus]|uniref:Uncharacterized protein n=1 Tax=Lupinus luteus TaxID=3873 RepID=A0AAV1WJK1_LUPLU